MSRSKNQNKNNNKKLDPIEEQVLKYFKQLNPEDISTVKDLTNKVKTLLKSIDDEKSAIFEKASTDAHELEEKIKADAHKSAENIEDSANKRAIKIIEEAEKEKAQILQTYEDELKQERSQKEAEWKEKDMLIKASQEDLENRIKEKEEELYKIKSTKFDDYEKELHKKVTDMTKSFEARIKDLNDQYKTFVEDTEKDLEEKNNLISALETLKQENKRLSSKLKVYQDHIQKYSTSKFTQLENDNSLLSEQVKQLEEMLRQANVELITYKKRVAELLSDPNLEEELELLKKENEKLQDFKNNSFSQESVQEWKQKAEAYDDIVVKNLDLTEKNTQLQTIIDREKVDQVKLSRLNTAHQILSNELEQARYDLEMRRDEYRNIENRFIGLNEIDEKYKDYLLQETSSNITLDKLVDRFRNYMASGYYHEKLYFDHTTLRAFIAGLAASNLLLLEGLSGTGKSSLPQAFGQFITSDKSNTSLVSVQQSWRDRNELLGYFNEFTKTYKETEFLKVLYEAVSDYNNIHIIVLDEMNIARVEYYFADFLSALQMQDTDRYINLISNHSVKDPKRLEDGKLLIGNNVWFVGTANDDDSTFMISDKVYDRAISIYFDRKGEEFSAKRETKNSSIEIGASELNNLFEKAIHNNKLSTAFSDKIKALDMYIKEKIGITFGNRIEKQLHQFIPVFVAAGGTQEEAFDLMFERKVLRKFESRLNAKMKRELDELELYIEQEFGEGKLKRSIIMIQDLKERY